MVTAAEVINTCFGMSWSMSPPACGIFAIQVRQLRSPCSGGSDLSSRKIKRCCRRAVKLKFGLIARYPFPQRPTKTHFYERRLPTAFPSLFGLKFPWLFRLIRVRTSSDTRLPVETQEFFLSSPRIAPYSLLRQIQTNSTAFLIMASDTSQYSAVVPMFRCPISFWIVSSQPLFHGAASQMYVFPNGKMYEALPIRKFP